MAKAFPNCGQESHTLVHVLALIFKITVLPPRLDLDSTRPPSALHTQLAVKDTSTDGPVFAATPKGDGPRPQDWRGGVRVRGAPFTDL